MLELLFPVCARGLRCLLRLQFCFAHFFKSLVWMWFRASPSVPIFLHSLESEKESAADVSGLNPNAGFLMASRNNQEISIGRAPSQNWVLRTTHSDLQGLGETAPGRPGCTKLRTQLVVKNEGCGVRLCLAGVELPSANTEERRRGSV